MNLPVSKILFVPLVLIDANIMKSQANWFYWLLLLPAQPIPYQIQLHSSLFMFCLSDKVTSLWQIDSGADPFCLIFAKLEPS